MVPIVEPEVLMDGEHTLEQCYEMTEEVLRTVFHKLNSQRVKLQSMILKPNVVLPGQCWPLVQLAKFMVRGGGRANCTALASLSTHRRQPRNTLIRLNCAVWSPGPVVRICGTFRAKESLEK